MAGGAGTTSYSPAELKPSSARVTARSLQVGQDDAVHRDKVWVILDQVRDEDLVDGLSVDLPLGRKVLVLERSELLV